MIELVCVRHAQPEWEPNGRAVDDPRLTALGVVQAERVAARLAPERFDELYSSPLVRARETAAPIERALGRTSRVPSWLAELQLPALEGTPVEEVERFFASARLRDLEAWWDGFPGGESFRHFHARVTGGLQALLKGELGARIHAEAAERLWRLPEQPERRLLVVAHAGTIAVMLSHLLGIEPVPWEAERFRLGWAGITRLRTHPVGGGGGHIWSLVRFNEREHLAGLDDPVG